MKDYLNLYLGVCVSVLLQVIILHIFCQLLKIDFTQALALVALIKVELFRKEYSEHTHEEE